MTTTVRGTTAATGSTGPRFGSRLGLFALVLVASIALPFFFLANDDPPRWYHLAFHLIGIPLCALGVFALLRLRQATGSRTLRVMTWVTTVTFLLWATGHIGELVTVLQHGGADADHDLFEHPVHVFFANIAVPSWLLTVLSSLVLLVAAGVQALRRRLAH